MSQGENMTKENEIKLVNALAERHVGNSRFLKKYKIDCSRSENLLTPYAEKDEYPPEEILEKAKQLFIEEFTRQALEILDRNNCNNFIKDLVFKTIHY